MCENDQYVKFKDNYLISVQITFVILVVSVPTMHTIDYIVLVIDVIQMLEHVILLIFLSTIKNTIPTNRYDVDISFENGLFVRIYIDNEHRQSVEFVPLKRKFDGDVEMRVNNMHNREIVE